MPRTACLIVRAVVARAEDRAAFDRWYATEHMPKAIAWLGAAEGRRFWSVLDPSVHYAVYRGDAARMAERERQTASDGTATGAALVAEFDQAWPGVTRTRDLAEEVDYVIRN